ncbi:MAG: hypothetical protein L0I76_30720 [Pseudonocardia sp.]|nr:hypothetical protein [Pseudonocardia sp.]
MRTHETTAERDPALEGLALGRIVLGAASLAAPSALARSLGVEPSPGLTYLTRIFAGRAIALGAGYLTEPTTQRRRWQRLTLFVDVADTLAALGHLRRRDLPRTAVLALGGLTGSYAVIGALRLRGPVCGRPTA